MARPAEADSEGRTAIRKMRLNSLSSIIFIFRSIENLREEVLSVSNTTGLTVQVLYTSLYTDFLPAYSQHLHGIRDWYVNLKIVVLIPGDNVSRVTVASVSPFKYSPDNRQWDLARVELNFIKKV